MSGLRKLLPAAFGTMILSLTALGGCLNVKAPEQINVGTSRRPPVDASSVPPTRDHAEARQKLAEAYDEIQHLQRRIRDLESDKASCKRKLKDCERKYDDLKDRYED